MAPKTEPPNPRYNIRYGWQGTVDEFQALSWAALEPPLSSHHQACMLAPPSASQVHAWRSSHELLKEQLTAVLRSDQRAAQWHLVLEYELPRERGRRPDVVVLADGAIIVLEFKEAGLATRADVDQVEAYARDLHAYHAASHTHPVIPVLVLVSAKGVRRQSGTTLITPGNGLAGALKEITAARGGPRPGATAWLAAPYDPLPSLVAAARQIFKHEPSPESGALRASGFQRPSQHSRQRSSKQRHLGNRTWRSSRVFPARAKP